MAAIFATAVRLFGIGGVLFILAIAFYEGVPGASHIPFLTSIPVVSDIIAGRVETFAAQRVKEATAGMASKYELQSVQFQLQRERELRKAADDAAASERQRAALSEAIAAQRQARIEHLAAEARTNTKLTRPTAEDRQWLDHN
ncbi:hypothetical protein [Aliirhizobium cellulosilyticum]|uniref:Uncharacterized protein n=1 Tax=Aliirhizobium cellulosilyticum TaxID=393664 RepID=A0A7W6S653_9HYPH|nr:hypothetical protein [Rhizobium cellulosilyticum]MBB4347918.1 hypothetical protein [Rhizobium cellulosilyticum]MBB4409688.1 hypothetical protein [Rhizobium cellulosilyticum]MBB4444375.1 hypothetical protein [Rhizobium cellulosilyticum]